MTEDKRALRALYRQRALSLDAQARQRASALIAAAVAALPEAAHAETIGLYMPLPDEPDILRPLLGAFAGREICLPRVRGDGGLDFCPVSDPYALPPGRWSIPAPPQDARTCAPDAVIVPALAYDKRGYRLGRGAGCYDRFLAGAFCAAVGVVYDSALLGALPRNDTDLPVGVVVTEEGIYRIK